MVDVGVIALQRNKGKKGFEYLQCVYRYIFELTFYFLFNICDGS